MSIKSNLSIAGCLILTALASPPARSSTAGWTFTDPTGALALEAANVAEPLSTVSLKNKSGEVITAVALSFIPGVHHYEDWIDADKPGLDPGESFEIVIGADESAGRKLEILAVIFDDGGGKGDSSHLEVMKCHRFGQILESSRVESILRTGRDKLDDRRVNDLARKIGRRPLSVDEAFSSIEQVTVPGLSVAALKMHGPRGRDAVLWGVSTAREGAMREVEMLKELPLTADDNQKADRAAFLSFVREKYGKRSQRGIAFINRMKGGR